MALIENTSKGAISFAAGSSRLLVSPGLNEVEDSLWNALKEHSGTKAYLSSGRLVVKEAAKAAPPKPKAPAPVAKPEPEPDPDPEGDGTALEELLNTKALDVVSAVEQMDDVDLLRDLLEEDDRVTVQRAVGRRLEELEDGSND